MQLKQWRLLRVATLFPAMLLREFRFDVGDSLYLI
jgi:hypothetical protein